MTTLIQFAPTVGAPFQFPVTLSGPTLNVTSTGTAFTVVVTWNTAGQRWYLNIIDQNGNRMLTRPLIGSSPDYPISLTGGYFASTLVFLEDSQQFMVSP